MTIAGGRCLHVIMQCCVECWQVGTIQFLKEGDASAATLAVAGTELDSAVAQCFDAPRGHACLNAFAPQTDD